MWNNPIRDFFVTLVLPERGEEKDEEKPGKDHENSFFKTEDPLRQGKWALGKDAVDQVSNADHEQAFKNVIRSECLLPHLYREKEPR